MRCSEQKYNTSLCPQSSYLFKVLVEKNLSKKQQYQQTFVENLAVGQALSQGLHLYHLIFQSPLGGLIIVMSTPFCKLGLGMKKPE